MRARKILISRAGNSINDYHIHIIRSGQSHRYFVMTEYTVPLSDYEKYALVECGSSQECEEWIRNRIKKGNTP